MAQDLSRFLSETIERELPVLRMFNEERASTPRGPGKWSPKEEVGHLIDSAANNHIRFVRAATELELRDSGYAQEDWVRLHGYTELRWETIVDFWFQYNTLLAALLCRIPPDRLTTLCFIAGDPPVPLSSVIESYILHIQHHIDQVLARDVITKY